MNGVVRTVNGSQYMRDEKKMKSEAYDKRDEITESDVIYCCIGDDLKYGIVACGFMKKETAERSQYHFSNEFYSCFLLLRGKGDYITGEGEVIALEEGDLVQRIPEQIHSTRVEPDGRWLEFFISVGAGFFETQKKLGVLTDIPVKKGVSEKMDVEHFQTLIRELKSTGRNELPTMSLKLQQEILQLFGYGGATQESESPYLIFQKACDFLSQNLEREISIEDVAKEMRMGYETFRKEFRRIYGVSPGKYRIEKKMEQAVMLLDSGIPIKEIARMVGYEDVYSFSKQFRKTYGIAPGKYRTGNKHIRM